MTMSMSFPLDDDGFLRRECPHCEREFKWHHGPTDDRPPDAVDPPVYWCPLCGESALPEQWWTHAQVGVVTDQTHVLVEQELSNMLEDVFRGSANVTYTPGTPEAEPPSSITEVNDMIIVAPPCHPWEPVKVPDDRLLDLHCLFCGQKYAA